MTDEEINQIFRLTEISNLEVRRSIIYNLGDGSKAIMVADLLIYLVLQYISFVKSHRRLLEAHDGFMIKSIRDMSFGTGLGKDSVSTAIVALEEAGLIETARGGKDNRTCVRIRPDELEKFIINSKADWLENKNWYFSKEKKKRQDYLKNKWQNIVTTLNIDEIPDYLINILNDLDDGNDPAELKQVFEDSGMENDWLFAWLFLHYYEAYYGKPYVWRPMSGVLLNAWRTKGLRNETEWAMSSAIKQAMESEEGSAGWDRNFEVRFRQYYNPGPGCKCPDMKFDNLRHSG